MTRQSDISRLFACSRLRTQAYVTISTAIKIYIAVHSYLLQGNILHTQVLNTAGFQIYKELPFFNRIYAVYILVILVLGLNIIL